MLPSDIVRAFFLFPPRNSRSLLTYVYTVYVNRYLIVWQKMQDHNKR